MLLSHNAMLSLWLHSPRALPEHLFYYLDSLWAEDESVYYYIWRCGLKDYMQYCIRVTNEKNISAPFGPHHLARLRASGCKYFGVTPVPRVDGLGKRPRAPEQRLSRC